MNKYYYYADCDNAVKLMESMGYINPLDLIYITKETNIPDNYFVLGFDTCHFSNNIMNCGEDYCRNETL